MFYQKENVNLKKKITKKKKKKKQNNKFVKALGKKQKRK
jgi:hypothetical protein